MISSLTFSGDAVAGWFYVGVYFAICYGLIVPLYFLLKRNYGAGNSKEARLARGIACVLTFLPLLPYLYVDLMTQCFTPTLRPALLKAVRESGETPRLTTTRILYKSGNQATVFVEIPCRATGREHHGSVAHLVRGVTGWSASDSGDTVYSDCGGNADGTTFPPYPHTIRSY